MEGGDGGLSVAGRGGGRARGGWWPGRAWLCGRGGGRGGCRRDDWQRRSARPRGARAMAGRECGFRVPSGGGVRAGQGRGGEAEVTAAAVERSADGGRSCLVPELGEGGWRCGLLQSRESARALPSRWQGPPPPAAPDWVRLAAPVGRRSGRRRVGSDSCLPHYPRAPPGGPPSLPPPISRPVDPLRPRTRLPPSVPRQARTRGAGGSAAGGTVVYGSTASGGGREAREEKDGRPRHPHWGGGGEVGGEETLWLGADRGLRQPPPPPPTPPLASLAPFITGGGRCTCWSGTRGRWWRRRGGRGRGRSPCGLLSGWHP